jgi:hypothetical protein
MLRENGYEKYILNMVDLGRNALGIDPPLEDLREMGWLGV